MEEAEPETNESAPFVAVWKSHEQSGTDDADTVGNDHGRASQVRPFRADESSADESEKLNRPTRNLKILRTQSVDIEGFDDDAGKLRNRRVGNLCTDRHDE